MLVFLGAVFIWSSSVDGGVGFLWMDVHLKGFAGGNSHVFTEPEFTNSGSCVGIDKEHAPVDLKAQFTWDLKEDRSS
jgi:hypothetical protein